MAGLTRLTLLISGLLALGVVRADDDRAHDSYMLHCQGCHLANTEGVPGHVPRMKDFLGYFLHSEEGRAFIVQVPPFSPAGVLMLTSHTPTPGLPGAAQDASSAIIATQDKFLISLITIFSSSSN